MSVREEDKQKTCPSRGLGVAAAAIGVGVGAALYYFFSKRDENPHGEGSTSSWTCNQEQALPQEEIVINDTIDITNDNIINYSTDTINDTESEQSDSTFDSNNDRYSETCDSSSNDSVTSLVTDSDIEVTSVIDSHSGTVLDDSSDFERVYFNSNSSTILDSDINESDMSNSSMDQPSGYSISNLMQLLTDESIRTRVTMSGTSDSNDERYSETCGVVARRVSRNDSITSVVTDSDIEVITDDDVFTSVTDSHSGTSVLDDSLGIEQVYFNSNLSTILDSDMNGSDMGNSSTDQPSLYSMLVQFLTHGSDRTRATMSGEDEQRQMDRVKALSEREYVLSMRQQQFRERSWSLEECSICFDVILKDQKITTLPCTHHFHSECIQPWLNEQQTCPNCRKQAE